MYPHFVIHYPYKCFRSVNHIHPSVTDLFTFYNNLFSILTKLNISYDIENTMAMDYAVQNVDPTKIYLAHQTKDTVNDNVWCVKTAYLKNYVYCDPTGYNKHSYVTKSQMLFDYSQQLDIIIATDYVLQYFNHAQQTNMSRYNQPEHTNFELDKPYFLYAYQNWYDDIRIKTIVEYMDIHYPDYRLVLKYHPVLRENGRTAPKHDKVIVVNNSIHDLIPNCEGIISTNSAVGFEALPYGKQTFIFEDSDYHWVSNKISLDTIDKLFELSKIPVDMNKIYKFMYFMMDYCWLDVNNVDKIEARIINIISNNKYRFI